MNHNGFRSRSMINPLRRISLRRGLAFGIIIVTALLAFEFFNFSTTVYALTDLLGELSFAGVRWALILAIAFCGIDFAGIARLFTPEAGTNEPTEVWYLFGAWLLAATMNAMLTWWGVSLALLEHSTLGNAVISRETLVRVVPVFVAVLVWLIRVLVIGTFSVAGDRLFSQADDYSSAARPLSTGPARPASNRVVVPAPDRLNEPVTLVTPNSRGAQKGPSQPDSGYSRPEPTYHPVAMSARPNGNQHSKPTYRR